MHQCMITLSVLATPPVAALSSEVHQRYGAQRVLLRQAGGADVGVQLAVGLYMFSDVLATSGSEVPAYEVKLPGGVGAVVALFDVASVEVEVSQTDDPLAGNTIGLGAGDGDESTPQPF